MKHRDLSLMMWRKLSVTLFLWSKHANRLSMRTCRRNTLMDILRSLILSNFSIGTLKRAVLWSQTESILYNSWIRLQNFPQKLIKILSFFLCCQTQISPSLSYLMGFTYINQKSYCEDCLELVSIWVLVQMIGPHISIDSKESE
jgi:hypothetical protein